jgi:tetratricopeptide (TPR) repeat protein
MHAPRPCPILTRVTALFLSSWLLAAPVWATCGGGGGGGAGGMSGGGSMPNSAPQVYNVPWGIMKTGAAAPTDGLVLYWIPVSRDEVAASTLRTSRDLTLWAGQGVTLIAADHTMPIVKQINAVPGISQAILTDPAGTVIGHVEAPKGFIKAKDVEKIVRDELKKRETAIAQHFADAKVKAKAGDKAAAIEQYQAVWAERALFPKKAKDAAKELKKLGITVALDDAINALPELAPVFDGAVATQVMAAMDRGLKAEIAENYELARSCYLEARGLDPADPAPARYLGELYRHHTGEWDKARVVFEEMLTQRIDPLSRAVALHGLGKMTIHEGAYVKGLRLMEKSVEVFPLALAYRNIAVFWNSECDPVQTAHYVELALQLDPTDPYNRVFAAVFMAQTGRKDEALRIAKENDALMAASYNLAAIYAMAGDRDRALAYLSRHFYQYERFDAVRSKEMMEARVDMMFDNVRTDREFVKLTEKADGMLPLPTSPRQKTMFPPGSE